jgi:hypothetical protein
MLNKGKVSNNISTKPDEYLSGIGVPKSECLEGFVRKTNPTHRHAWKK